MMPSLQLPRGKLAFLYNETGRKEENIEKIHIYNDNVWICDQTEGIICYNTNTKTSRTLNDNSQGFSIGLPIVVVCNVKKHKSPTAIAEGLQWKMKSD